MSQYKVVIDTNVLVTGLRSSQGASFKLLKSIGSPKFQPVISVPLVFEYEAALTFDKHHSGLSTQDIRDILDYLCSISSQAKISYLWRPQLTDPKDDFVLELAVNGQCDFIITYNKKDFLESRKFGVKIISPVDFLKLIGEIQ